MFEITPFDHRNLIKNTDAFLSNFFNDFTKGSNLGFRTDIKETEDNYLIQSELPGVKKDEINIEVNDNYLTISARNNEIKEEKKENYVRKERRVGSYQRSFQLDNVDTEGVKAKYDNGLLEITLPKKEPKKNKNRKIDIH